MSDRIFGVFVAIVALAYIASATQIQTSFLSDPVGSKTFPMLVGGVALLCAILIIIRPDEEPQWPAAGTFLKIGLALVVLVGYAYTLKPLGFLIPTAIAAGALSYQIRPRLVAAILTGLCLSIGLFMIFKFALGLGLAPYPKTWFS